MRRTDARNHTPARSLCRVRAAGTGGKGEQVEGRVSWGKEWVAAGGPAAGAPAIHSSSALSRV